MTSLPELLYILKSSITRPLLRLRVRIELQKERPNWPWLDLNKVYDWAGDLYARDPRYIEWMQHSAINEL